jgi:copper chaperone CopZ
MNYVKERRINVTPVNSDGRLFVYKTKAMGTIHFTIPNMKNQHCQMTVTRALETVGASVVSIAPTKAVVQIPEAVSDQSVIDAIKKAGYNVTGVENN